MLLKDQEHIKLMEEMTLEELNEIIDKSQDEIIDKSQNVNETRGIKKYNTLRISWLSYQWTS